jgi:hypothetical protein
MSVCRNGIAQARTRPAPLRSGSCAPRVGRLRVVGAGEYEPVLVDQPEGDGSSSNRGAANAVMSGLGRWEPIVDLAEHLGPKPK